MSVQTKFASTIARIKLPIVFSRLSKKALWGITIVLVLAIAGGAVYYYQAVYQPAQTASTTTTAMQTATVRQGNLVLYASGTGTLVSASEADLAFKTGGQVTAIPVEVGDQVKASDLLAQVDDRSVQAAYTQARRTLMELTSPSAIASAQTAIADAETTLASAQNHLEYILGPNILYWEAQVAKGEADLKTAQAALDKNPSD